MPESKNAFTKACEAAVGLKKWTYLGWFSKETLHKIEESKKRKNLLKNLKTISAQNSSRACVQ